MTDARPAWLQRNFTLGNVLTILAMLGAAYSVTIRWSHDTEMLSANLATKISYIEKDVTGLKAGMVPRETLDAKLDAITDTLNKIDQRLDRIEQRK